MYCRNARGKMNPGKCYLQAEGEIWAENVKIMQKYVLSLDVESEGNTADTIWPSTLKFCE